MPLRLDNYLNVLKMATVFLDCILHTSGPISHGIDLNDRFYRMHRETK